MDLIIKLIIILISLVTVSYCQVESNLLKCYSCNSLYTKCGERDFFDATVQEATYCSGQCVKVVVYPGTFIIRTCSTLLMNITDIQPSSQECYLGTYRDLTGTVNKDLVAAYYCYCNDRVGCNKAAITIIGNNQFIALFIFLFIFSL